MRRRGRDRKGLGRLTPTADFQKSGLNGEPLTLPACLAYHMPMQINLLLSLLLLRRQFGER